MPEPVSTRPLLDKLGVRPGARIGVLGVHDTDFRRLLAERTGDVTDGDVAAGSDLVFLAAEGPADLGRLGMLERLIRRDGAIWVVSRKGREATLRDVEVIGAAKAAGLVDNKVVSFSATHTAIRLVIPVVRR